MSLPHPFALCLLVASLLPHKGVAQGAQPDCLAQGRVLDAVRQMPLPGATVFAMSADGKDWASALTDEQGRYTLELFRSVSYELTFAREDRYDVKMELGKVCAQKKTHEVKNAELRKGSSRLLDWLSKNPHYRQDAPSGPVVTYPYYVRLAALSDPQRFDADKYRQYGEVEIRPADKGLHIVLIGGFASLDDARRTLRALQAKGHRDAFVVRDDGDILVRM
ncbi:MAG: carboxypeptidase regulatory-like domain-containing protein [Saprospiraceae bacterium]